MDPYGVKKYWDVSRVVVFLWPQFTFPASPKVQEVLAELKGSIPNL